jgi:hypothetical protein
MSWVSVADLLALEVPVHWPEAVAIVADVCTNLMDRGDAVIPHAADVLINGVGKLAIRSGDGETDPAALGRMLHNLADTAPTPAPLRLFVSHAISSERYHSVSAFAEALTAYEVPGRDKQIQAVHDRWVAARSQVKTSSPDAIPMRPEPEQEKKEAAKSKAPARRASRWAFAAVALLVVAGGAAGAWFATSANAPALPSLSWSIPAVMQDALAWLGAGRTTEVAAAQPEPTEPKPARPARRRASAAAASPAADAAATTAATDTTEQTAPPASPTTQASEGGVAVAAGVSGAAAPDVIAASAGPASDEALGSPAAMTTDVEPTVYSSASPNIMPPVVVTRQLTPREGTTAGLEEPSTIEVVVDESGKVERVRLLSRPSPILAAMLLSAAKTWQFRPALNDGQPVKYRLLVDVMTTRP